jgi:hypothetical protein
MTQSGDHQVGSVLAPDEIVHAEAEARDARLLVTDRRVVVAADGRTALALPIEELRRIQFDVEKTRPATLVIVPEAPGHEPQVLAIPHGQIRAVTEALALIGERLSGGD